MADDELSALKKELTRLRQELVSKLDELEQRIDAHQADDTIPETEITDHYAEYVAAMTGSSTVDKSEIPAEEQASLEPTPVPQPQHGQEQNHTVSATVISPTPANYERLTQPAGQPSEQPFRRRELVFSALWARLLGGLGPLGHLIEQIGEVYRHYKTQGRLPVFFMTAAGIVALVLGFGYLLQYSFHHWFTEWAKIIAGFVISTAVIVFGARLGRRSSDMGDYAASLIGMGVILNYLCIYFATSYYHLVGTTPGFILLSLNTVAAYILALVFKTRVVATVSFLGAVFTPFFLGAEPQSLIFYLSYLWVLCVAALHLSRLISWTALAYLSFVTAMSIVEYALLSWPTPISVGSSGAGVASGGVMLGIILHVFFYLYIYYALFDGWALRQHLDYNGIFIVTGSIALFLFNQYEVQPNNQVLGITYSANALPFLALIYPLRQAITSEQRAVMMLIAGILAAVAVPVLFDADIMGLIWGIEAVALTYLGFVFGSPTIRREGYIVLLVAIGTMIWAMLDMPNQWQTLLTGSAYINLVLLGPVLWLIIKLLHGNAEHRQPGEEKFLLLYQEGLSVWMSVLFLVTAGYFWSDFVFGLAAVPMFYLSYRGHRHALPFTQIFAFCHYFLILLQVALSIEAVGSFFFLDQTPYGKVATLEAYFVLWLYFAFYQRVAPNSQWQGFSRKLQVLFYVLMPLVLVPPLTHIMRLAPDYLPLTLWGSFAMNYLLLRRLRLGALRVELLWVGSIAGLVALQAALTTTNSGLFNLAYLTLTIGIMALGVLLLIEQGLDRRHSRHEYYGYFFTGFFLYLGAAVYLYSFALLNDTALSLLLTGLYFLGLSMRRPVFAPLRNWLRPCHWIGVFGVSMSILVAAAEAGRTSSMDNWLHLLTGVTGLVAIKLTLQSRDRILGYIRGRQVQHRLHLLNLEYWAYHFLVVMVYLLANFTWFGDWTGPMISVALVVHGIAVLFQAARESIRSLFTIAIAVFVVAVSKILLLDMAGFTLVEKVIAFLVIGVTLLAAAYRFHQVQPAAANALDRT